MGETNKHVSNEKREQSFRKKKLNKIETSNLPDAEFKTLFIRMLNELRGRVVELSENFNKGIENIKMEIENIKNQS